MAKDKKPDFEENLVVEGLAALRDGDVEGGMAALRVAKDIQDARDAKEEREKK